MKDKKMIIGIVVLLVLGIGGFLWYSNKQKGGAAAATLADVPGIDGEYAKKLAAFMTQKWGSDIAAAALEYSTDASRFASGNDLGDYKIGGQWTKTGSIMAAFGSSVHSWAADGQPAAPADWQAMFDIWNEFKAKKLTEGL